MYDNIKVGMNTNIVILCICVIVEVSLIKKSMVNGVRVDDWAAEWAIIASNG